MSEISIDIASFIAVTTRFESLRSSELFSLLGNTALNPYAEPVDLETLGIKTGVDSAAEKAEDDFDAKAAGYFDAERVQGYHLLASEAGRIALSSEAFTRDSNGELLPHTVLAAKIVGNKVHLMKLRQYGVAITFIDQFPEDTEVIKLAISELAVVNERLAADSTE